MKRRSLTVLLCLLAIISLASVGFASWVISAGDEVEATGNITVEKVTDERLTITDEKLSGKYGDGPICFTAPGDTSATNGWLKVDEHTKENLEATLTFKVGFKSDKKKVEYTKESKNIDLKVDWAETTKAFLQLAKNESLIKDIPDLDVLNDTLTFDSATSTFTVNIKFEWGSAFEGQNPFTFYNSKSVKDGYYIVDGVKYFKVTEGDTDKYYTYNTATKDDLYDKIPSESPENPGTFISWGDDANQKLSKLFEIFQGTADENGIYKDKEYVIVIKADPVAQQIKQ